MRANLEIPQEIINEIKQEILAEVKVEMLKHTEEIFSVKEFAEFMGVSLSTAYNLIKNGGAPVHEVGNKKKLIKSEVIDWLKENQYVMASDFDGIKKPA